MPGAVLTGSEGDTHEGKVKVKVGPVTAEYKGSAEFVSKDDDAYRAELSAKGRDTRGAGNAEAVVVAQLTEEGGGTKVSIDTELKVSGKVAQFGRGVMADVSKKLIGQFAECLEQRILDASGATIDEVAEASAEEAEAPAEEATEEPEALDLMSVAGGAMAKRLIPVAIAVVAVVVVLIILL